MSSDKTAGHLILKSLTAFIKNCIQIHSNLSVHFHCPRWSGQWCDVQQNELESKSPPSREIIDRWNQLENSSNSLHSPSSACFCIQTHNIVLSPLPWFRLPEINILSAELDVSPITRNVGLLQFPVQALSSSMVPTPRRTCAFNQESLLFARSTIAASSSVRQIPVASRQLRKRKSMR